MRVHYIVVLLGALATSVSADVSRTDSKIAAPRYARSLSTDRTVVRGLRSNKPRHDSEERGIFDGALAYVDDFVKNLLKERTGWALIDDLTENVNLSPKISEMLKKNTPVDEAFKALEVEKVAGIDNLLESQQWKEWAVFVIKRSKDTPDEALSSAMSIQFGLDRVSSILANAGKNPKTKAIAEKLEEAQLKRWLSLGSDPDKIFEALKLNTKFDSFFDSPQFATWTSFLKAFNAKNSNKKEITGLDVLLQYYKEDSLTKLIVSADNVNSPRAQQYLDELLLRWRDQPLHPQHVFTMMKLDEAGDALLTNPLLSRWVKYMEDFNEKYPLAKTSMIQTFTKNYGDEKVATMLQAAAKASDADTAKIASTLQEAQFKNWMVLGLTPDEVYNTVLKITSTSSPKADIWRAYYNAYEKEFPGKLFSFNP
ncbi:hypothetical protein AM588_10004818 [Phytophthora nicotianae]|uniref:RxLR effector protein n=1 Tax=Phytophthora nicotianae TaxID=4792 RepID=A0A0W8DET5_PHYNI|nr:hypothetical protein AM588_10004818 [Phytophthora nicotianae]